MGRSLLRQRGAQPNQAFRRVVMGAALRVVLQHAGTRLQRWMAGRGPLPDQGARPALLYEHDRRLVAATCGACLPQRRRRALTLRTSPGTSARQAEPARGVRPESARDPPARRRLVQPTAGRIHGLGSVGRRCRHAGARAQALGFSLAPGPVYSLSGDHATTSHSTLGWDWDARRIAALEQLGPLISKCPGERRSVD